MSCAGWVLIERMCCAQRETDFLCNVAKIDLETGSSVVWSEDGCYAGEPIFLPVPDGGAEDDGVVLSVVLSGGPFPPGLAASRR